MKVEESLNVTFNETPSPSKTSPLVDDDLDEEEAIRETEKKNIENIVEDETLEIDKIVNIKESRNHPLENIIGNLNQITLRSQAQNQSNFFCFISTIEPKNVNEALGDESWIVADPMGGLRIAIVLSNVLDVLDASSRRMERAGKSYSEKGEIFVEFIFQNQYLSLSLEDFAQILRIPCKGACVFSDRWSLDELVYGSPSEGPYQTNLPSPDDIISYIREDREGQVTRVRHQEEVKVQEYQILTREIVSTLKPLEEINRENVFCLEGNRDHIPACLCYMLYCVANSKKFNLAYFMAKRIEWVTKQARLILPYGMLLTRLFDFLIGEYPELKNESYVLYNRVMNPLAAQLERKPRKDRSTRRGRPFTSSSTFDQPSSSHLNDDDDDGNDEGTSHNSYLSLHHSHSLSPQTSMDTQVSSSHRFKKIKLTIIPPRQLFVDLTSDNENLSTPSPTTTSSSPTPPNAPSQTTSTKETTSNVPPRPSNLQPLQSIPSLDITLSLSPITPFKNLSSPSSSSPPPPQPPIMGHSLYYNYHDYHESTCICRFYNRNLYLNLRDEMNIMFAHLEYLLTTAFTTHFPPQP
ncbi:hypothetical protein Tco_1337896 [Tanacetum coccineum]